MVGEYVVPCPRCPVPVPVPVYCRSQFEEWDRWTRDIGRRVQTGDPEGLARMRVVMKSLSLRRTKALLATKLPEKTVYVRCPPHPLSVTLWCACVCVCGCECCSLHGHALNTLRLLRARCFFFPTARC